MVSVAFHGRLADAAWREPRALDLPSEIATIGALREWLPSIAPGLADQLDPATVRAAIGDTLVGDEAALLPNSEVAFLPPVSGG